MCLDEILSQNNTVYSTFTHHYFIYMISNVRIQMYISLLMYVNLCKIILVKD